MKTYYKRYLPHITPPGGTFFITATLENALPIPVMKKLREEKNRLIKQLKEEQKNYDISPTTYREELIKAHKRHFLKIDRLLDKAANQEYYLKDDTLANIVANKFKQYDGKYYILEAYCVMSNHFHLLIDTSIQLENLNGEEPTKDNYTSLSNIMQFIKGGSAFEINKALERKGTFWRGESYDHLVRNDREHNNIHWYILNNPVKAKMVVNWKDYPHTYSRLH